MRFSSHFLVSVAVQVSVVFKERENRFETKTEAEKGTHQGCNGERCAGQQQCAGQAGSSIRPQLQRAR